VDGPEHTPGGFVVLVGVQHEHIPGGPHVQRVEPLDVVRAGPLGAEQVRDPSSEPGDVPQGILVGLWITGDELIQVHEARGPDPRPADRDGDRLAPTGRGIEVWRNLPRLGDERDEIGQPVEVDQRKPSGLTFALLLGPGEPQAGHRDHPVRRGASVGVCQEGVLVHRWPRPADPVQLLPHPGDALWGEPTAGNRLLVGVREMQLELASPDLRVHVRGRREVGDDDVILQPLDAIRVGIAGLRLQVEEGERPPIPDDHAVLIEGPADSGGLLGRHAGDEDGVLHRILVLVTLPRSSAGVYPAVPELPQHVLQTHAGSVTLLPRHADSVRGEDGVRARHHLLQQPAQPCCDEPLEGVHLGDHGASSVSQGQ